MDGRRKLERVSYATSYTLDSSSPSSLGPTSPRSTYQPSEATTLCEKDQVFDTVHPCSCNFDFDNGQGVDVKVFELGVNHRAHYSHDIFPRLSGWCLGEDDLDKHTGGPVSRRSSSPLTGASALPSPSPNLPTYHLKAILSGLIGSFSDYKARRRISAIRLRVEQCRRNYHPLSVKDLQMAYEYLRDLEHRRKKIAFAAFTLRLSVLELLFDIFDTPVLFSEQRKNFFHKIWLDLDNASSRVHPDTDRDIYKQIMKLKQRFFLRVLDELPLNHSISDIIPDGASVVQALCRELAYGSGVYAIQKVLAQIARTEWGHRELSCLAVRPSIYPKEKEGTLTADMIIDCITRLLSFRNAFSHAMAFRIFGRVAELNTEVYALLAGPRGVVWLVDRLNEQTYTRTTVYWSFRQIETYCHALMAACAKGFVNCVLQSDIVSTLLHVVEIFTARDEAMHSVIEDNQQDDSDIELDQIACCELIILLMKTPSGKKQFLDGCGVLETFMKDPNRSFSDWKLSLKLTVIEKLLHD